ncbi:MAG: hypothetical protein CMO81_08315 [Waddliaceae bacterium]|nr:hypothetical protein [Waddliaceae bacterium]
MSKFNELFLSFLFLFFINFTNYIEAKEETQSYKQHSSYWDSVQDNLRVALDISTRAAYNSNVDDMFYTQFIGVDLHKVFSSPQKGDWATVVLQLYATRIDWPGSMKPFFFNRNHEWKFVPRITTINFTGIPGTQGSFNIKIGHFELPFGLETQYDTNGTLHDYMHMSNLGAKVDWGFTINGVCDKWEYETGLSRGSGIDFDSSGHPWLITGRAGHSFNKVFQAGFSYLFGKVKNPPAASLYRSGLSAGQLLTDSRGLDGMVKRYRLGFDCIYGWKKWTFQGELTCGEDFSQNVCNNLVEVNWQNGMSEWLFYSQVLNFNQDFTSGWDSAFSSKLGAQWTPDNRWELSAQLEQQISNFFNASRATIITVQGRARF